MAKNESDNRGWHPDFRISEELPDVKALRTGFLVRSIIALALLLTIGQIAYRFIDYNVISDAIVKLKEEISLKNATNQSILARNKDFLKNRSILLEFDKMFSKAFYPNFILDEIHPIKPNHILIEDFKFELLQNQPVNKKSKKKSEPFHRISLDGQVDLDSTTALQILEDFTSALRNLELLQDENNTLDIDVLNYDSRAKKLPFTLIIELKG